MPRGGNGNNGGNGVIRGNNKDNVLNGTNADDIIRGRGGNDDIFAGAGDDEIHGGSGNDTINAGSGTDIVTGGSGADVFVIDANSETVIITDFEDGVDQIDVSAFGFDQNGYSPNYSGYLAVVDDDTYVTFYDNTTGDAVAEVILQDFDYTQIDLSDYIL